MNKLATCLAPILVVIACSADHPAAGGGTASSLRAEPGARVAALHPATAEPATLGADRDPGVVFAPCAPGSQDNCSGQVFGTACVSHPGLVCLPFQPAPGGGSICNCR